LIAAQEKTNATTVEFCGFVGTASNDVLRLYPELDTSVYVEIPKEAIVYVEKDGRDCGGVKGRVRVFVSASKEVTEVSKRRVGANESFLSQRLRSVRSPLILGGTLIDREGFRPTGKTLAEEGKACIAQCEADFASGASRANLLWLQGQQALAGGNTDLYTKINSEAVAVAGNAVAQLRECLRQCPVLYSPNLNDSVVRRVSPLISWYYNS
jgi:hypothetical protein